MTINDIRSETEFKGISFSKYKLTDVKKQLMTNLKNSKIEPSCYWSAELICAGHFLELWENIFIFVGKYIHIGNPKIIIYLEKRFLLFQSIINEDDIPSPHHLRNHTTIRRMFAEIVATLTLSNRKHSFEPIRIKRKEEFDMTQISDRLHAPSTEYANDILKKKDPKELFIPINEFSYHLSNGKKDTINACYWIEWLIEFSIVCNGNKCPCVCQSREDNPVEPKYQTNVIWILWDVLFYHCYELGNKYIEALLNSLHTLFCIKYTTGTNKRRRYLLYFAVALLTEEIPNDIELMPDKPTIKAVCDNINLVYKQIKKKEHKPTTDYLFANIEKETSLNASMQKMDLVNSANIA